MTVDVYTGLMAKVLSYGDMSNPPFQSRTGYAYLADGFDRSHVPDLIRILDDDELADADADSSEVWAQGHAWRILGQLRAEEAILPLLRLLHYIDERDDDWVQNEVPEVLADIGPTALEPAAHFLSDTDNGVWARVAAIDSLKQIAMAFPDTRSRCVEVVTGQLAQFAEQDEILNTFLIDCLIELKAVESAPLIERAFAAGAVDVTVRGDWEDAQIDLGLLDERTTPKPNYLWERLFGLSDSEDEEDDDDDEDDDEYQSDAKAPRVVRRAAVDPVKKKRKRKEAQKQRKVQRKKKKK